jgi:hypothetical protein
VEVKLHDSERCGFSCGLYSDSTVTCSPGDVGHSGRQTNSRDGCGIAIPRHRAQRLSIGQHVAALLAGTGTYPEGHRPLRFDEGLVPDLRGDPLTTNDIRAFRAKAAHCSEQASSAKDDKLRKYWTDLADGWIALEHALIDKEGRSILPL